MKTKFIKTRSTIITKKYERPFLVKQRIDSYNAPMIVIVGNRGIGKTFGYTLEDLIYSIEHNSKLVYIVETQDDISQLSMNNGEKFFSRIIMELQKENSARKKQWLSYFEGEKTLTEEIEIVEDGKLSFEIKKGVIKLNQKSLGFIIALNDFAHLKRNNFDESYKRFIIDEFIPEKVDIRTRKNPYKVVSIFQSMLRQNKSKDIKIRMFGNSIRNNDSILQALEIDNLQDGEIRRVYDEFGLLFVAHKVDINCYPNFKRNQEESLSGRLAKAFGETSLDDNTYFNDINKDLLCPRELQKSIYAFTIHQGHLSIRFQRIKGSNELYALENYGYTIRNHYCVNPQYVDIGISLNLELKETLINLFKNKKIKFDSRKLYFDFKEIMKLK